MDQSADRIAKFGNHKHSSIEFNGVTYFNCVVQNGSLSATNVFVQPIIVYEWLSELFLEKNKQRG